MIKIGKDMYGMWPEYVYHDRVDADQDTYDKLHCGCRTAFTGGTWSPDADPGSYCDLHTKRYREWMGLGGQGGSFFNMFDPTTKDGVKISPDTNAGIDLDEEIIPWEDASDKYAYQYIYAEHPLRSKPRKGALGPLECQCIPGCSGGPLGYFNTGLSESCELHMPRYKQWLGYGKSTSESCKPVEQRDRGRLYKESGWEMYPGSVAGQEAISYLKNEEKDDTNGS